MKKVFCSLCILLFVTTACENGGEGGLGSDISQDCSAFFGGFILGIVRGSLCLCEGEARGEFQLGLGPVLFADPLIIGIGRTAFGVEEKDESTFSLFNTVLDTEGQFQIVGDPVGEIQNLVQGSSSLEFLVQLGEDPPERIVCPACYSGPRPIECDPEREIDKLKCLDPENLVETGSSCPADSIVRVCSPYFCRGELFNEESGVGFAFDGFQLPSDDSGAFGCNTIVERAPPFPDEPLEGNFTFTEIATIPPAGTMIGPIPEDGIGEGPFDCRLEFPGL